METIAAMRKLGPFRLFLAAFVALSLAGLMACSSDEGRTPECVHDFDDAGMRMEVSGDPCNPFATCAAAPNDPAKCCEGKTGGDLELCLYGYGVLPQNGSSSSSSGGGNGSGGGGN